jgi:hypothetical protein
VQQDIAIGVPTQTFFVRDLDAANFERNTTLEFM